MHTETNLSNDNESKNNLIHMFNRLNQPSNDGQASNDETQYAIIDTQRTDAIQSTNLLHNSGHDETRIESNIGMYSK